jgi:hypothetical protein
VVVLKIEAKGSVGALALPATNPSLCITGASPPQHLAPFRGIVADNRTASLSQNWRKSAWLGESGLQAC